MQGQNQHQQRHEHEGHNSASLVTSVCMVAQGSLSGPASDDGGRDYYTLLAQFGVIQQQTISALFRPGNYTGEGEKYSGEVYCPPAKLENEP